MQSQELLNFAKKAPPPPNRYLSYFLPDLANFPSGKTRSERLRRSQEVAWKPKKLPDRAPKHIVAKLISMLQIVSSFMRSSLEVRSSWFTLDKSLHRTSFFFLELVIMQMCQLFELVTVQMCIDLTIETKKAVADAAHYHPRPPRRESNHTKLTRWEHNTNIK